jgi:hypothetical protein
LGKNLIPKAYCFGGLIPSIGDYRLPIYRIEDRQSKINNERTLHSDDNRPADCQRFLKSTQVAFTKFIKILHCCQQKSSDQSETRRAHRTVAVFRQLDGDLPARRRFSNGVPAGRMPAILCPKKGHGRISSAMPP